MITFRVKDKVLGKKPSTKRKVDDGVPKTALPVFTVDTLEEASDLQTLACKLSYDGRFILWPKFSGELADVPKVTERFREMYDAMRKRR